MNVTYLYHSGFLVETQTTYYIFDYYKGTLPKLNISKPVYVFSSHFHPDHFNPAIFEVLDQQNITQIHGILSWDISPKRIPQNLDIQRVKANCSYILPGGESVETLHSTDEGVAFLVTGPEGVIYHAGDLNDWVWEEETTSLNHDMTKRFQTEIDKLTDKHVDIAFLPLDPRQGKDYARGMVYFLEHVKTDKVYPMHYWEQPQVMVKFLEENPKYSSVVLLTEPVKNS